MLCLVIKSLIIFLNSLVTKFFLSSELRLKNDHNSISLDLFSHQLSVMNPHPPSPQAKLHAGLESLKFWNCHTSILSALDLRHLGITDVRIGI